MDARRPADQDSRTGSPARERGVTVVVPTLDRPEFLLNTLADLLAQNHRPIEILIVDQSSQPAREALALAGRHADLIRYHHVCFRGSAKARNYGWRSARYDAIVFLDDDIRCGPDLIGAHLRALKLPGVGLVAGGVENVGRRPDAGPPTGRFLRWTATPKLGFEACGAFDVDHVPEGNFGAWRKVLASVGGIDEAFDVPAALYEGVDLGLRVKRAGYRVYYEGSARLKHFAAPRGGNRVVQPAEYVWGLAHNRAMIIRRHVRWYHVPSAMGRLAALGAAYALYHRQLRLLAACIDGVVQGCRRPLPPRLSESRATA